MTLRVVLLAALVLAATPPSPAPAAPEPVEVAFDLTGLPLLPFGGEYLLASTLAGTVTGAEVRLSFTTAGTFQAENFVFEFGGPTGGIGPLIGSQMGWSGQGLFNFEQSGISTANGEVQMQGRGPGLSYWFLNISPTADSLPTPVQGELGPSVIRLHVQPCLVDWDGSFFLSVEDLFRFLADYFASSVRADLDGSGTAGVGDIFMFLSLYFAGCDAF